MISGSVTINGVSDKQLRTVLDIKIKNEDVLNFNPQVLQPVAKQPGQTEQRYNNMFLSWTNQKGLKAVETILVDLATE